MPELPRPQTGLTIIELMITLAVAAILIASATPSMQEFIQNNRAVSQVNDLQAALGTARSEAITRNNNVTICASSNGSACAGNWADGWIVFVDDDFDGTVDAADGDVVLRVYGALTGGNTLTFTQNRVTYASSGIARDGSNGVFMLCDNRGTSHASGVVVGRSGRPRLASGSGDFVDVQPDDSVVALSCS